MCGESSSCRLTTNAIGSYVRSSTDASDRPDCLSARSRTALSIAQRKYSGASLDAVCVKIFESASRASENVPTVQSPVGSAESVLAKSIVCLPGAGDVFSESSYAFAANTNDSSFERPVFRLDTLFLERNRFDRDRYRFNISIEVGEATVYRVLPIPPGLWSSIRSVRALC